MPKFHPRVRLNRFMDWLRFQIDTFPILDYQPLPWLGKTKACRSKGVLERIAAILHFMEEEKISFESVTDVGSNVGYYAIEFALRNKHTFAIEANDRFLRTLLYAKDRLNLNTLYVTNMHITPTNSILLPQVDVCLFLSTWHHLVRQYGLQEATDILKNLFLKTKKVLFFETGETEMPVEYKLPDFTPDPRSFLEEYLKTTCQDGNVTHVGVSDAFDPQGNVVKRNLFAVVKVHYER